MRNKMHLKKGLSLLAVSVALVFLWVAFSGAVVECPDDITINNEGWPDKQVRARQALPQEARYRV